MKQSKQKATGSPNGVEPESVVDQDRLMGSALKAVRDRLCVRLRGPSYLVAKNGFTLDTTGLPELASSLCWLDPVAANLGFEVNRHLVAFDGYFHAVLNDRNKSGTLAGMDVTPEQVHKPLRKLKDDIERVAKQVAGLPPEKRAEIDRADTKHLKTAQGLSALRQKGLRFEIPSVEGGYEEIHVPEPIDLRRTRDPDGELDEVHGSFTGEDEAREALIFEGHTLVFGIPAEERSRLIHKSGILRVRKQDATVRYKKVEFVAFEEQKLLVPGHDDRADTKRAPANKQEKTSPRARRAAPQKRKAKR